MRNNNVLLVEDHPSARQSITKVLRHVGLNVVSAPNGAEAVRLAQKARFAVAIVDLRLPDLSGTEAIRRIKELGPNTELIIVTAYPSFESSIEAIREDVYDYLLKPLDMDELIRSVRRAMERRRLILEKEDLLRQLRAKCDTLGEQLLAHRRALEQRLASSSSFVGESEAIRQTMRSIAAVAPSSVTVLILGESGTGKDVVARLIHESSGRSHAGTLVRVNCPAVPETLLESELFGHEAGAFTGATKRKLGRFELADRGTILLNEIGQIPPGVQAKLLEAIEEKQFVRLGGEETIRVDTRVLAATNAPLEHMVSAGEFRLDLFYRLNEYTIQLPPLRERMEDIPILVQHFLRKYGPMHGRKNLTVSSKAMSLLLGSKWPGNVRELETVIRRYAVVGDEEIIQQSASQSNAAGIAQSCGNKLADAEAEAVLSALIEARGNQRQAARVLGIGYSALRRRIAKHGLKERLHAIKPDTVRGAGPNAMYRF